MNNGVILRYSLNDVDELINIELEKEMRQLIKI